jgi:hypothetical protein
MLFAEYIKKSPQMLKIFRSVYHVRIIDRTQVSPANVEQSSSGIEEMPRSNVSRNIPEVMNVQSGACLRVWSACCLRVLSDRWFSCKVGGDFGLRSINKTSPMILAGSPKIDPGAMRVGGV